VSIILKKYVAYYRVSTKKQGESGLGLEAQQKAVRELAARNGATIIAEYIEVETGKRADRPRLAEALTHVCTTGAKLIIAKLDRLARNVHFISGLMESGVPFDCADRPGADPFRLHIEAAIAEEEARKISERTKAALERAAARGVKLGSARDGHWDGREHLRQAGITKAQPMGSAVNAQAARDHYSDVVVPKMKQWREEGKSLDEIAALLNADGFTTRRDRKPFTKGIVWRLIDRYLGVAYLGNKRQPVLACAASY